MGADEMKRLGDWMNAVVEHRDDNAALEAIGREVQEM